MTNKRVSVQSPHPHLAGRAVRGDADLSALCPGPMQYASPKPRLAYIRGVLVNIIPGNEPYLLGGPGPFGPGESALENPPYFPYHRLENAHAAVEAAAVEARRRPRLVDWDV